MWSVLSSPSRSCGAYSPQVHLWVRHSAHISESRRPRAAMMASCTTQCGSVTTTTALAPISRYDYLPVSLNHLYADTVHAPIITLQLLPSLLHRRFNMRCKCRLCGNWIKRGGFHSCGEMTRAVIPASFLDLRTFLFWPATGPITIAAAA